MGAQLEQMGWDAASNVAGAGLGLILGGINNKRQVKQQKKLTNIQTEANKDLALFNNKLQMDMWNNTNYEAQMEHLKGAGLNPGLLYGQGGGGGATVNAAQAGPASGGQAGQQGAESMALMGNKMQLALMQAQKENIEADTQNKQADATYKGGVQTDLGKSQIDVNKQNIENLAADVENTQARTMLTKTQGRIAEIEEKIKGDTQEEVTSQMRLETQILHNDMERAVRNNWMDEQTKNNKIAIVGAELLNIWANTGLTKQKTAESGTNMDMMKSNMTMNETRRHEIITGIQQKWEALTQGLQNANTAQKAQMWNQFINDVTESTHMDASWIKQFAGQIGSKGGTTINDYGSQHGHINNN